MKLKFILIALLGLYCCSVHAQEKTSRNQSAQGDAEFNIDLRLPTRLVKLSSDETTIRFTDRKSKATLEINRNRFSEFSGQNSAEAELLYIDKMGDPNCFEVSLTSVPLKVGSCEIVNWKTKRSTQHNDQNSTAMLEVGGTTYDFHMNHSSINEKEMTGLLEKILKSIKRSNK